MVVPTPPCMYIPSVNEPLDVVHEASSMATTTKRTKKTVRIIDFLLFLAIFILSYESIGYVITFILPIEDACPLYGRTVVL